MPAFKKKQKHYFRYDVNRLIRLIKARDRVIFEYFQEGDEDANNLSDEELAKLPVEKILTELQAKSTVLLFESSSRLEKVDMDPADPNSNSNHTNGFPDLQSDSLASTFVTGSVLD